MKLMCQLEDMMKGCCYSSTLKTEDAAYLILQRKKEKKTTTLLNLKCPSRFEKILPYYKVQIMLLQYQV